MQEPLRYIKKFFIKKSRLARKQALINSVYFYISFHSRIFRRHYRYPCREYG